MLIRLKSSNELPYQLQFLGYLRELMDELSHHEGNLLFLL